MGLSRVAATGPRVFVGSFSVESDLPPPLTNRPTSLYPDHHSMVTRELNNSRFEPAAQSMSQLYCRVPRRMS